MNLSIRGCEDTRLQASTHKPKYMRTWGCEDINKYLEYMNLRIWGCKDARIQARTHELKDMRMRGYRQLLRCKIYISISIIYISVYMIYISNDTMQSTFIFWCMIHQTLPDNVLQSIYTTIVENIPKSSLKDSECGLLIQSLIILLVFQSINL